MILSSLLLIFLACIIYGVLHSLLASLAAKEQVIRLGVRAARGYRLFFNGWALLSLLPVLLLVRSLPDAPLYQLDFPWLLAPLALQAAGVWLVLGGVRQTGALAFAGLDVLRPGWQPRPAVLVTGGLYRWVRHPLYTGSLLVLWLQPGMTGNTLAFAAGLTVYLFVGMYFEERKLLREFGPAYAAYQRRTPRLLPCRRPEK